MPKRNRFGDIIYFVLGPCIIVFSLFSFDYKFLLEDFFGEKGRGVGPHVFYYPWTSRIGLLIGLALFGSGLLARHWQKNVSEYRELEFQVPTFKKIFAEIRYNALFILVGIIALFYVFFMIYSKVH
jgi:hypothetical protein